MNILLYILLRMNTNTFFLFNPLITLSPLLNVVYKLYLIWSGELFHRKPNQARGIKFVLTFLVSTLSTWFSCDFVEFNFLKHLKVVR